MQRAGDCNMVLVHDDELERIHEIGEGSVSEHSIISYIVLPMLAVTRILTARSDDGFSPDVQHRDT
jgi:hypothetical protein